MRISAGVQTCALPILTLAFAQIVWSIAYQWDAVTGGSNGIVGIWPEAWLSGDAYYYFTLIVVVAAIVVVRRMRSEEHTSELQSLMRISYAVFCLKKKKNKSHKQHQ